MNPVIEEACERVNARLASLGATAEATVQVSGEDAALLCAGTGLPGPELVDLVKDQSSECEMALIKHMVLEGSSPGSLATVASEYLIKLFWLGYELGRESL